MKFSISKQQHKLSAYGGKGFQKRQNNAFINVHKEYSKLKSVILYKPELEIHQLKDPNRVQHLEKINSHSLQKEIQKIITFFKKQKIEVNLIPADASAPPNLMFMRDLIWSTSEGMILARMGSEIRKTEEVIVASFLLKEAFPLAHIIPSPHTLEAADCLWLNQQTLLVGVKNRTSTSSLIFLKKIFPGIEIIPIPLPQKVQHLLGLLNIVDQKKALIRHQIAPKKLIQLLLKHQFQLIKVDETKEVFDLQGMNVVVLSPNKIIMPDDCPNLETIYKKNNIRIVQKFKITELRKAAGGLACMVGILKRLN